jgi:hypothetical protein
MMTEKVLPKKTTSNKKIPNKIKPTHRGIVTHRRVKKKKKTDTTKQQKKQGNNSKFTTQQQKNYVTKTRTQNSSCRG